MTKVKAVDLLLGEEGGFATALTWLPDGVLLPLTWESGIENDADALEAVASAFALDLCCVSASVPWAPEATVAVKRSGIATGWLVNGVFSRLAEKLGWSEVLKESAAAPGELAAGLDEVLHETLADMRRAWAAGADVVVLADELAGAAGWLVAPDFALEALIPCYRAAVGTRPAEAAVVFHSDGDVRALMSALKGAGFNGLHFGSPGRATVDVLVESARAAGLVPLGGIETDVLRGRGASAAGRHAVRLASAGPIILADDGGLTAPHEVAAFGAALESARDALGEAAE